MNMRKLEILYTILKTGSITEASHKLGVSQPAISSALRHFEDSLGMKLFRRVGGRLQPTPEAELVFPELQVIFERLDSVNLTLENLANRHQGQVNFAVNAMILYSDISRIACNFNTRNPNIEMTIQKLPSSDVLRKVINREVDFGISHIIGDKELNIVSEKLLAVDVVCIMNVKHPCSRLNELSPEDVVNDRIITYRKLTKNGEQIWAAFGERDLLPERRIFVNDAISALVLLEEDDGIAIVLDASWVLDGFKHLTVRPFKPRITVQSYLLRDPSAIPSTAVTALIDDMRRWKWQSARE